MKIQMHGFLIGDMVHPRSREVYEMVNDLIGEVKLSGYEPALAFLLRLMKRGAYQRGAHLNNMHQSTICKALSFHINLTDSLSRDGVVIATDDAEPETLEMYMAISCKHVIIIFEFLLVVIIFGCLGILKHHNDKHRLLQEYISRYYL